MFIRQDEWFIIATNNIKAASVISECMLVKFKMLHCLQLEIFPSMMLYKIVILMPKNLDVEVEQFIREDLDARHLQLFTTEIS